MGSEIISVLLGAVSDKVQSYKFMGRIRYEYIAKLYAMSS